jgi:hypothetical protein
MASPRPNWCMSAIQLAPPSFNAVRRSSYAHARLRTTGKLAPELFDAGERFSLDFERARVFGNYARHDMFKTRAGKQEMTDRVALAAKRTMEALGAVGGGRDPPSRRRTSGVPLKDHTRFAASHSVPQLPRRGCLFCLMTRSSAVIQTNNADRGPSDIYRRV